MIPIPPLSVKFSDDERAQIKALAKILGWPESQVVRDSVNHVLQLIHHPELLDEPKLITLARLALAYEQKNVPLPRRLDTTQISPSQKVKQKKQPA